MAYCQFVTTDKYFENFILCKNKKKITIITNIEKKVKNTNKKI